MSTACPAPSAPVRFVAVVTTVGSLADAQRLARALVERRLVACAQISEIQSIYRWNDALVQEPEWRLLLKTRADTSAAVMEALRTMHPYEVPALHTLALYDVDAAYGSWIDAELQRRP